MPSTRPPTPAKRTPVRADGGADGGTVGLPLTGRALGPWAPLAPLVRHYDDEGGRHAHGHAQVLIGLAGCLEVEVEGRGAWVDAHCGLVVPAAAVHTYCASPRAQVLVLDAPEALGVAAAAVDRWRHFALPPGWQAGLAAGPGARAVPAMLQSLWGTATLGVRRRIDLDALARRVDADLARPWTVADLAAECCLSPQRLRARFAEALGQSPLAFVRTRRLNRAEQLLARGMPLQTVASLVGYGQASALSAALRRERGTGARPLRQGRALRTT